MRKHFGLCKRKSFRLNDFKKRIDLSNSISSVYSPAVTTAQDWNPQSRVLHGGASRLHKMGNGLQLVSGRLGLCWEYSSVSLGIFQWDTWTWRRPGFPARVREETRKGEGVCGRASRGSDRQIPRSFHAAYAYSLFFLQTEEEKKIPDFSRSLNSMDPKYLQQIWCSTQSSDGD